MLSLEHVVKQILAWDPNEEVYVPAAEKVRQYMDLNDYNGTDNEMEDDTVYTLYDFAKTQLS